MQLNRLGSIEPACFLWFGVGELADRVFVVCSLPNVSA